MRLKGRSITRQQIIDAIDKYEIIEAYPEDKYLPSYLLLATQEGNAFHVLLALDLEADNIRVVTAYRPDPAEWEPGFKKRRRQ